MCPGALSVQKERHRIWYKVDERWSKVITTPSPSSTSVSRDAAVTWPRGGHASAPPLQAERGATELSVRCNNARPSRRSLGGRPPRRGRRKRGAGTTPPPPPSPASHRPTGFGRIVASDTGGTKNIHTEYLVWRGRAVAQSGDAGEPSPTSAAAPWFAAATSRAAAASRTASDPCCCAVEAAAPTAGVPLGAQSSVFAATMRHSDEVK